MKRIFVSFADTRYIKSLERIKSETEQFGFDERYFLTEKDLPKDFFKGFNPQIYRRGFGYWTWKPYIVNKMLEKLDEGDILVYSDAGTQWHISGKNRFEEYINMLSLNTPLLTFQQPFLTKDWTKGDVFHYICSDSWLKYAMELQLWAGTFLLKKNELCINLFKHWTDIAENHRYLMTDLKSDTPNLSGFIEHRHDQSVFSLLAKQIPHIEISWQEVEPLNGEWNGREEFPIWAKRDKSFSFIDKIKRKFRRLFAFPVGMYLKYIKGFYFQSNISW